MKLNHPRPVVVLVALLLVSLSDLVSTGTGQLKDSTIKKKSGQVIRGAIQEILIQAETGAVNDEAARGYGGLYCRVPGDSIEAIDEEGVHLKPNTYPRYVLVGKKEQLDDIAILEAFHKIEEGGTNANFLSLAFGVGIVKVDSRSAQTPIRLRLRGEFRMEGDHGRLLPAIEIKTETGSVSIPVEDIVEFKR